jgi:hypothetical protein
LLVDCANSTYSNQKGEICTECQFFPYPLESPWDGPVGLSVDPLSTGKGIVKKFQSGADWYFPLNIFLNPFDGRCTSDCAGEGRHYVNPFEYDPQEVLDWYTAYDGNDEMFPWSRRNLDIIPDGNKPDPVDRIYWAPYNFTQAPFKCVCDRESGFVHDDAKNDGSCFNCGSIGQDDCPLGNCESKCAACHYQNTPVS